MSPVLFCIYIDNLLEILKKAGVGCFIGLHFVGALAYADDFVLIAPTISAMKRMLAICDAYAREFDIKFNAQKSGCLIFPAGNRRYMHSSSCVSKFSIGGEEIEFVESYTHLGHIITSSLDDTDDILYRRNLFIGQANSVLCFFSELDSFVKLRLFKAYCSSLYGSVLWSLDNRLINDICSTWRRGMRRAFGLPFEAHGFILPLVSESLPLHDELFKRCSRFAFSCLFSCSGLVRSISWHAVSVARFRSPLGRNVLLCCSRYGWSPISFLCGRVCLTDDFFNRQFFNAVTVEQLSKALLVCELVMLREGIFQLTGGISFSWQDFTDLIAAVACN